MGGQYAGGGRGDQSLQRGRGVLAQWPARSPLMVEQKESIWGSWEGASGPEF